MHMSTLVLGALASILLSASASLFNPMNDKFAVHGGALLSRQDTDCPDFDDCDCVDWGLQCLEKEDMTWVSCDNGAPQDTWPDCTTNSTTNATSTSATSTSATSISATSISTTSSTLSSISPSINSTQASTSPTSSSTSADSASLSSASVASASLASVSSASLASVSAASVASISSASVASVSSASAASIASIASASSAAAAATATPEASCHVSNKFLYHRVHIDGIENWSSDDVQSSLKHQESGCGAITDWTWSPDTGSGASAHFNLPPLLKKGCPGRAIGSAGGPSISC